MNSQPPTAQPPTAIVSVPMWTPSIEEQRAMWQAAFDKAAREMYGTWLRYEEAARYLRMHERTFERKRVELDIPTSKLDRIHLIHRANLDALMVAHSSTGGRLLKWPEAPAVPLPPGAKFVDWPIPADTPVNPLGLLPATERSQAA